MVEALRETHRPFHAGGQREKLKLIEVFLHLVFVLLACDQRHENRLRNAGIYCFVHIFRLSRLDRESNSQN